MAVIAINLYHGVRNFDQWFNAIFVEKGHPMSRRMFYISMVEYSAFDWAQWAQLCSPSVELGFRVLHIGFGVINWRDAQIRQLTKMCGLRVLSIFISLYFPHAVVVSGIIKVFETGLRCHSIIEHYRNVH